MNAPVKLAAFMPWVGEGERDMRRRILLCQRLATIRAVTCVSDTARDIFWTANRIAGERAFAPARGGQLRDIRDALLRLFQAADAIERLERGND